MTITEQNSLIYLFETKIVEAVNYVPKMCGAEKFRAIQFWNTISEKLQNILNGNVADINAAALQLNENEPEKIPLEMNNGNSVGTVVQSGIRSDFAFFTPNYKPSSGSDKDDHVVDIGSSHFLSSEPFPTVSEATVTYSTPTIHHISSTHNGISDSSVSIKSESQLNCDKSFVNSSCRAIAANETISSFKKDMLKEVINKEINNTYQSSENNENCSLSVYRNESSMRTFELTESISKTTRKKKVYTARLGDNIYSKDKFDCDENNSFVMDESSEGSFDNYKSDFEVIESAGDSNSGHTESIVSFVVSNTEEILTKNKIALNKEDSDDSPVSAKDSDKKMPCDLDVVDPNVTYVKSYACTECSSRFKTKGNLVVHMRTHTGEKPFSCNKCGSQFTTKGNLQRHQRTHTGEKPFECNCCFSKFTEKKSLIVHIRCHTGLKPYQCNICGKKFAQAGVLQSHLDVHLNQKCHLCEHCGKFFRQKSQLHVHRLRHDNIKKFSCPSCEAKFLTKGDLERHIRIHTGERPFVCKVCSKSFTRQQTLNEHTNRHYGIRPYICKHCSRAFSEMSACYKNELNLNVSGMVLVLKAPVLKHEKTHNKDKEKPAGPDDSQSCEVEDSTDSVLIASASDPLARMMTLSGIF